MQDYSSHNLYESHLYEQKPVQLLNAHKISLYLKKHREFFDIIYPEKYHEIRKKVDDRCEEFLDYFDTSLYMKIGAFPHGNWFEKNILRKQKYGHVFDDDLNGRILTTSFPYKDIKATLKFERVKAKSPIRRRNKRFFDDSGATVDVSVSTELPDMLKNASVYDAIRADLDHYITLSLNADDYIILDKKLEQLLRNIRTLVEITS